MRARHRQPAPRTQTIHSAVSWIMLMHFQTKIFHGIRLILSYFHFAFVSCGSGRLCGFLLFGREKAFNFPISKFGGRLNKISKTDWISNGMVCRATNCARIFSNENLYNVLHRNEKFRSKNSFPSIRCCRESWANRFNIEFHILLMPSRRLLLRDCTFRTHCPRAATKGPDECTWKIKKTCTRCI